MQQPQTYYLLFQLFVNGVCPEVFPPNEGIDSGAQSISKAVVISGDTKHKLGFAVGPIAFNQSENTVHQLISQSFEIARRRNLAVAFHLDDHMFWEKNSALANDKSNIEWIDWTGTSCKSRRLDWGPHAQKVAPQLCFNSPALLKAVSKRSEFIGHEIKLELDKLRQEHREELFAGVIAGWESQIGRDYTTGKNTGYHALKNAGLSPKNSISECDEKLIGIVKNYISAWSSGLKNAGVPKEKIFCHIAFAANGQENDDPAFARRVNFATPSVAFNSAYNAGFSTYPEEGTLTQIQNVTARNSATWISAEGTNVQPNGQAGEPDMETYLASMFNHGASIVNIFSWGIGGEAHKNNFFRRATEGPEAINAYRKFLSGKILVEKQRSPGQFSAAKLRQKIQTIQEKIPHWMEKNHRPDLIQPKMLLLDAALKEGHPEEADRIADELLKVLGQ